MRFVIPARPDMLRWTSLILFGLVGLFLIAFGSLYASVTDMLWFHASAVPEAIRDQVHPLYFALMKLIGGASIALGGLGLWVVFGPLRRGLPGAAMALAAAFAVPLVMAAYVAETLAAHTGAPTSWHLMGIVLAVIALAFLAHLLSAPMRGPFNAVWGDQS
jgi:hypothetical protein